MMDHVTRLVALLGLLLPLTAAAATVTLQGALNGYTGATDTYLKKVAPTNNYGTAAVLQDETGAQGIVLKFKIFHSEGGPIPNGATIGSAILSLYKATGGATTFGAFRLLKAWNETQATWNRASNTLNWTVPGATGSSTDRRSAADGTAATTTSAAWLNIPVTSGVIAIKGGAVNHGWRLIPTAGATTPKTFHSRHYTTNTTLRPKLTVTYTITAPSAPIIGTATAGNAQATVSFTTPPSDGGSPITGYTVTSTPSNHTATGTASPITITGLTNGTTYTFTVIAQNAVGTSAPSAASNAVTPATVPDAPIIGMATAGNAQATVSFTAPTSDGGSAITGYTVTSTPGDLTATGTLSPLTITGLTNATTYTFTVTATNALGESSASAASNPVTPVGEPLAPTLVSALPGDGKVTVHFNPPTSDGGSPITSYSVTASPGGNTVSRNQSPLTVTGLTNGTAYTFTVTGQNALGTSLPSAPSDPVTPEAGELNLYFVHADHLNTPRLITDLEGTSVWDWEHTEPFGHSAPNPSPTGGPVFTYNLRFPGQYFDQESGLYYNYFRDYDPATGRYIESDPIGLEGGPNTFAYVTGNPTSFYDPFGLAEYPNNFVGPLPPDGYYTSEMTQTICGKVPPAPPGTDINKNMQHADKNWNPLWFYDQVRNKGPWDYKQQGRKYADFGNFNFGAAGAAFGLPDNVLHRSAGWANLKADPTRKGLGNPWGKYPYGDSTSDQEEIGKGINYCECMGY